MSFNSASPELISDDSPTSPNVSATAPRHGHADTSSSRSCVTCRRRKVRCNKRNPCSNCTKAGIECIFPPPGRAPRKSKRPPDAELLSRLRRLEGVIDHLRTGNGSGTEGTSTQAPSVTAPSVVLVDTPAAAPANLPAAPPGSAQPQGQNSECPFADSDPKSPVPHRLENEFGRLVIDEGRSRYVSNRLWASLGDEVCYIDIFILIRTSY
jgi:hypothetical protein